MRIGLAGSRPLRVVAPLQGSRLFFELTQQLRAGLTYAAASRLLCDVRSEGGLDTLYRSKKLRTAAAVESHVCAQNAQTWGTRAPLTYRQKTQDLNAEPCHP